MKSVPIHRARAALIGLMAISAGALATIGCAQAPTATPQAPALADTSPAATEAAPAPTDTLAAAAEGSAQRGDGFPAPAEIAASFAGAPQAEGEVLVLFGRVTDRAGEPLPGVAVEIWQTDAKGVYDHPDAPDSDLRDPDFGSYGTSVTDAAGLFSFRTVRPGRYEPRPSHIHVKIRQDGRELLTTQLYFADEVGDAAPYDLLALAPARIETDAGTVLVARRDIVLTTDEATGTLPVTPARTEGRYYPCAPVADNDDVGVP